MHALLFVACGVQAKIKLAKRRKDKKKNAKKLAARKKEMARLGVKEKPGFFNTMRRSLPGPLRYVNVFYRLWLCARLVCVCPAASVVPG